jgi:hypothetical protein
MVLLENFGAEPLTAKLEWSNGSKFVCLLRRKVIQPVTPGIPKFWKESHSERAKDNEDQFFHTFFYEGLQLRFYFIPFKLEP